MPGPKLGDPVSNGPKIHATKQSIKSIELLVSCKYTYNAAVCGSMTPLILRIDAVSKGQFDAQNDAVFPFLHQCR